MKSTGLSDEQFAASHPRGIGRGYWHTARNGILWAKLSPTLKRASAVLDIGCGPGIVVNHLASRGVDAYGVDLSRPQADPATIASRLFLGQSAFELEAAFRERVSHLLLMDVLEHLPAPEAFLASAYERFPNARYVYITVPAAPELWSNYDEFHGHFCRYSMDTLAALIELSPYRLREASYFFHSLYWAARAMKLFTKERSVAVSAPKFALIHRLIGRGLVFEQKVLPATMPGSSLFALIERSD